MKRYSLIVVLHIIGIAFLSVGVYLLVDAGLWFQRNAPHKKDGKK